MKGKSERVRMSFEKELGFICSSFCGIIFRLDPDGRIIFINDMIRKYGYEPDDLVDTDFCDIIHHEDVPRTACRIKERRSGGRCEKSFKVRLMCRKKQNPTYLELKMFTQGLYETAESEKAFLGTQGIARELQHDV